jgi:UDP-glucose 4-epimerase
VRYSNAISEKGIALDIKGSKILVIGGAGLIGSHLVEKLTQEDVGEIVVYDNFCRGTHGNLDQALRDPRVRIFETGGDICQTDILNTAMDGMDSVFHLAALWLLQCHEFPRAAFGVNVGGTFNVLEGCVRNGVQRLVFSSSALVYGDAVEVPMTEDHPFNNRTFYGASKIAGEQMCRAFHHRYGLDYVGLRYMNVYGPRQDYKGAYIAVIMKILDRLDKGLPPIVYGDGSQSYDFIYVGDVGHANVCALKSNATDAFYNIGMGTRTTIRELCELILEITGSSLGIQYEPAGQTFVTNRVGSTDRAKRDLAFEAEIGLREGLTRLIQWRKKHRAESPESPES